MRHGHRMKWHFCDAVFREETPMPGIANQKQDDVRKTRRRRPACDRGKALMVTLNRGGFRIEAAAVAEPNGFCCVTAEVFDGMKMIRVYYRRLQVSSNRYPEVEWEVAEDVARMSSEAE